MRYRNAMRQYRSYADKLRDPRWQKKRLEVMNAANFACQSCMAKSETLAVHHPFYENSREPWEYDNLVCLCETCHKQVEATKKSILELLCALRPYDRASLSQAAGLCVMNGDPCVNELITTWRRLRIAELLAEIAEPSGPYSASNLTSIVMEITS